MKDACYDNHGLYFGCWHLDLLWMLDVGAWSFPVRFWPHFGTYETFVQSDLPPRSEIPPQKIRTIPFMKAAPLLRFSVPITPKLPVPHSFSEGRQHSNTASAFPQSTGTSSNENRRFFERSNLDPAQFIASNPIRRWPSASYAIRKSFGTDAA